jgi:DNA-directed RNA polymerase specialized sigma24 family protein
MMAPVKERAIDERAAASDAEPVSAGAEARHDFERVYRDHGPGLFRAIFAYTGGRRDIADEVVAEAFARAIAHDLLAALRRLSPNQRAAIVLRYEADLPVDEVARRMGIAAVTVRVHIHRGRSRLRELLGAEEVDEA